ncbi:MAG: CBS domain-containing protein [Chloroflexi bacterium]|nr:CBS domain-containing protein [Chloroflexota bacterium]
MPFLSQILGKEVRDREGKRVGKLKDVIVPCDTAYPSVSAIEISLSGGQAKIVPWRQIESLEPKRLKLKVIANEIEAYQLAENILALARDVLDKQIVDTEGVKIVRVNDLQLNRSNGQYRLVAVDNSTQGLLRRLGFGPVADVLGKRWEESLISWDDVDLLPSNVPAVKLKVPLGRLRKLHPADIAEILNQLSATEGTDAVQSLDDETAATALAEVEPERQAAIIEMIDSEKGADILEEMAPDDAADVLGDVSEEKAKELLDLMEPEAAQDARELMAYPEDSAGGLMTTEYVALSPDQTAQEAIDHLRKVAPEADTVYYLYVTDAEKHLSGVVSLRDLVVAAPGRKVSEFMHPDAVSILASADRREVTTALVKYNLLAIPVVDDQDRMLGVVTVDDVMEVVTPRAWRRKRLSALT